MSVTPDKNAPENTADCAVIIVAAGNGTRAASPDIASTLPKQFWQLGEKPVFRHALDHANQHPRVGQIFLVVSSSFIEMTRNFTADLGDKVQIISGGVTRQDSVRAGLTALNSLPDAENSRYVAIHDAARPLIPDGLIESMLEALDAAPASVAGVIPVLTLADSLKSRQQNDDIPQTRLDAGPSRSTTVAAQTPQIFHRQLITRLHNDYADKNDFTDDCALAEAGGHQMICTDGAKSLMKLTDATDFAMLASLLNHEMRQDDLNIQPMTETRTGTGFDVHAFGAHAGTIWVAGVALDSPRAIVAHSDGDVALHALCDAIFGALAEGDIGAHFPPSDPRWKDADSSHFLNFAMERVAARGGRIINLDVTIICEMPKIDPHRDKMRQRISDICAIPLARVSVKATTSEKLGFTGRGEGIAAQASANICLPASR